MKVHMNSVNCSIISLNVAPTSYLHQALNPLTRSCNNCRTHTRQQASFEVLLYPAVDTCTTCAVTLISCSQATR